MSYSWTEAEASIRGATDSVDTARTTQALLLQFANEEFFRLRRRLADAIPDLYTKTSSDLVIAPGTTTIDISSITDFGKIRSLGRREGTVLVPLRVASPLAAFSTDGVDGTYVLSYVTKPSARLTNATSAIDLPDGMERALIEAVCARVRVKEKEDPSFHVQASEAIYGQVRDSLIRQYLSTPQNVIEGQRYCGVSYRLRGASNIDLTIQYDPYATPWV